MLDGRWLFKFLLFDILEYASKTQEKKLETQSVAILMKRADEIVMQQLILLAKNIKTLKIVTELKNSFSYIENELYEKYGIGLQITNNKAKSLSNVDIIINFDFDEESINEYNINENATIININQNISLNKSRFKGININDYEIRYNKENFKDNEPKSNFDSNILYESYIYRKDTFSNIQKQLKNDNVELIKLA